jgi:excisionase family DNA binding protein
MTDTFFKQDPGRLMTCEEVADFLRIEKDTLAKWRETGRVDLPFVKLGLKEIRYRYGDIVAFIEKRMAVNTVAARGLDGRA